MKLAAGNWALEAAPEWGGAILSLTRAGCDVLRPTPAVVADPFDLACFPLVPYANRIAAGSFLWGSQAVKLPRNHPEQAHPLHGTGWLMPWSVVCTDETSVTMRLEHAGDETWPWAFAAEQRLVVSAEGLLATLEVENTGERAMPVSLGFHPYFAAADRLRFVADGVWLADKEMLPAEHAAADALGDWSVGGALVRPDLVDHCYTGWRGVATIERDDGDVVLTGEGTSALHVYVPPGEAFFCAEPVTAMPDAVNRGEAASLAPGARTTIAMRISG
ncbi:aldose 1-epimerase [Sphingomonas sp. CCH5-D11]|uniref:aldose 1-epimerase n=1 Tax=Sphingomonas sp. CCH5-D11 TaxID=1768786 RepID=UPI000834187E|nr:aldose 1-epimerase [Sphingomonas sp. CCH5-D11]